MGEERRLLVRGFPHWLTRSEKQSLLQHFGATEVVAMPSRGKMRNCVFATFASHEDAKRALPRLHQLAILQSRLVVEYVQDKHPQLLQDNVQDKNDEEGEKSFTEDLPLSPKLSPTRPSPAPARAPRLAYHYPPPSPSTITNITHTLLTVPKFYFQVLHLMNLMNLPPPFGPATAAPPGLGGPGGSGGGGSDVESEVDSESEARTSERPVAVSREVKHRAPHLAPSRGLSPPAKRRLSSSAAQPHFHPLPPLTGSRKISLNVPSKIEPRPPHEMVVSVATLGVSVAVPVQPAASRESPDNASEVEEEGEEEGEGEEFITSDELARNRLSPSEMKGLSVFGGYRPGEPSLRLYIKNLARHTTEKDLRCIYGRYIDWSDERQRTVFDVRVMQTGRMKGQAFIGLPSEEAAAQALRETNGYQLAGKPMIVHFARTAKAKPEK